MYKYHERLSLSFKSDTIQPSILRHNMHIQVVLTHNMYTYTYMYTLGLKWPAAVYDTLRLRSTVDLHVVPFVNLRPKQMAASKSIHNSELLSSSSYLVNVPIMALMKPTSMMMAKMAPFSTDCSKVLQSFKKKWHPKETRCDYEKAFSTANWKALPLDKKQLHTLANCKACHKQYPHLQLAYPQGPYYEESILSVNTDGLQLLGEKKLLAKL